MTDATAPAVRRVAPGPVLVWGNCQSPPLQALLAAPLRRHGFELVPTPTVYQATEAELAEVHRQVAGAAVLVSQPVPDVYRYPGSGTEHLAGLLPPGGRLVRVPSVFHTAWFPYQVNAHTGAGVRIAAPLVDYHDLRLIAAAAAGRSADEVLARWPEPPPAGAVAALAARSLAELRRREVGLDVTVSDTLAGRDALFALNHPSNVTLAVFARRVLAAIGLDAAGPGDAVVPPEREFLGEIRTAVDAPVAAGLGHEPEATPWRRRGVEVDLADIVSSHLEFYRDHPDVVDDSLRRYTHQLETLGLRAPAPDHGGGVR